MPGTDHPGMTSEMALAPQLYLIMGWHHACRHCTAFVLGKNIVDKPRGSGLNV